MKKHILFTKSHILIALKSLMIKPTHFSSLGLTNMVPEMASNIPNMKTFLMTLIISTCCFFSDSAINNTIEGKKIHLTNVLFNHAMTLGKNNNVSEFIVSSFKTFH